MSPSAPRRPPFLDELLETVHEFGRASLELAAWELSLEEHELAPAFSYAVRRGLLVDPAPSPETGEQEYALGARARAGTAAGSPH